MIFLVFVTLAGLFVLGGCEQESSYIIDASVKLDDFGETIQVAIMKGLFDFPDDAAVTINDVDLEFNGLWYYASSDIGIFPGETVTLSIEIDTVDLTETLTMPAALPVVTDPYDGGGSGGEGEYDITQAIEVAWTWTETDPQKFIVEIWPGDLQEGDDSYTAEKSGASRTHDIPADTLAETDMFGAYVYVQAVNSMSLSGDGVKSGSIFTVYCEGESEEFFTYTPPE